MTPLQNLKNTLRFWLPGKATGTATVKRPALRMLPLEDRSLPGSMNPQDMLALLALPSVFGGAGSNVSTPVSGSAYTGTAANSSGSTTSGSAQAPFVFTFSGPGTSSSTSPPPDSPSPDAADAMTAASLGASALFDANDGAYNDPATEPPSIAPPTSLPADVPADWAYAGAYSLNPDDNSTSASNAALEANLPPATVAGQESVTPQTMSYSHEYILAGSRGDTSFLMDVTVDSTVQPGADATEAGTVTSTVWLKTGDSYAVNQPAATRSFSQSVAKDASGKSNYVGISSAGGINLPALPGSTTGNAPAAVSPGQATSATLSGGGNVADPANYGIGNSTWDHVYKKESFGVHLGGTYQGSDGQSYSYTYERSSSYFIQADATQSLGVDGFGSIHYAILFGGHQDLHDNVHGGAYHEDTRSWEDYGGHDNVVEKYDDNGVLQGSTVDYRNNFTGGSSYSYGNSGGGSVVTRDPGTSRITSRVDYTFKTVYDTGSTYTGYLDSQQNTDGQGRANGSDVRKIDSVDTTTNDSYRTTEDATMSDDTAASGSSVYSKYNIQPITASSGVFERTTLSEQPVSTGSNLFPGNPGGAASADDRGPSPASTLPGDLPANGRIWYASSDGGYRTETTDKRQNKTVGGGRIKPLFGSGTVYTTDEETYHTSDSGHDNTGYGSGDSFQNGSGTDKNSVISYGKGTPGDLEPDQTGHSTFNDTMKVNSSSTYFLKTHYSPTVGTVTDTSNSHDESHAKGSGSTFAQSSGARRTSISDQNDYKTTSDGSHTRDVTYNAAGQENGSYSNSDASTSDTKETTTENGSVPNYIGDNIVGTKTFNDRNFNHEYQAGSDSENGSIAAGATSGTYTTSATDNNDWTGKQNRTVSSSTVDSSSSGSGTAEQQVTDKGTLSGSTTYQGDESGSVLAGTRSGTGTVTTGEDSKASLNTTDIGTESSISNAGTTDEFSANDNWNNKSSLAKTVANSETAKYTVSGGSSTTTSDTGNWSETLDTGLIQHLVGHSDSPGWADSRVASDYTYDRKITGKQGVKQVGDAVKGRVDQSSDSTDSTTNVITFDGTAGTDGTPAYHDVQKQYIISNAKGETSSYNGPDQIVLSLSSKTLYDYVYTEKKTQLDDGSSSYALYENRIAGQSQGNPRAGTGTTTTGTTNYQEYALADGRTIVGGSMIPDTTTEDTSWPQTTWLGRNWNTAMNVVQVAGGLVEIAVGAGMVLASCGGGVVPGVVTMGVGVDSVAMGVAGLIDGQSYGSAIGYAASQGMQAVGVPEGVADVIGELVPIALTLGSSALATACFASGTKLQTPLGLKPIEEFQVGDWVLSRDEYDAKGLVEPKRVEELFRNLMPIWHLHVGDALIRTTGEHPLFVENEGWVAAKDLKIGDKLATRNGYVELTDLLETGEWEAVFNLRIADHHTYFVGDEGWGFEVWAHNTCAGLHHYVPMFMGSKVARGTSTILTFFEQIGHIGIHRALNRYLKPLGMMPSRTLTGQAIRALPATDRLKALVGFYKEYQNGAHMEGFLNELRLTFKAGLFK